jgi:RNA polymerase sigma-70 factor (ECF subfamily)
MEGVRSGSKEAFLELMRRWQSPLSRHFSLLGVARSDLDDCTQETFLRVFRYRDRYRQYPAGFRAFLFRIARNVAADSFRDKDKTRRHLSLDSYLDHAPAAPDPTSAWENALDVREIVSSLPARLREPLVLVVFDGLSYAETAELLGVPLGTVKSRMHHALNRLREVLTGDAVR